MIVKFLKWFSLIFIAQLLLVAVYVILHPDHDMIIDEPVAMILIWPLLVLPVSVTHGGELFYSWIATAIYSSVLSFLIVRRQNRKTGTMLTRHPKV